MTETKTPPYTLKAIKKYLAKKKETDPIFCEKQREYQRQYYHRKKQENERKCERYDD